MLKILLLLSQPDEKRLTLNESFNCLNCTIHGTVAIGLSWNIIIYHFARYHFPKISIKFKKLFSLSSFAENPVISLWSI